MWQTVWIHQTDCKGYWQTTKVASIKSKRANDFAHQNNFVKKKITTTAQHSVSKRLITRKHLMNPK